MTIRYHLNPDLGALHFELSGPLDSRKYSKLMQDLLAVEYDRRVTNFLWDLRLVDGSRLTPLTVFGIAEMSQPVLASHGLGWKSALVISSDLQYGLARMVESFINAPRPSEIRVFKDLLEAEAWILQHRRDFAEMVV